MSTQRNDPARGWKAADAILDRLLAQVDDLESRLALLKARKFKRQAGDP
jgi:hypothetical protein